METKQALEILSQISVAAQKAGLLTLQEAVLTVQAIEVLKPLTTPKAE